MNDFDKALAQARKNGTTPNRVDAPVKKTPEIRGVATLNPGHGKVAWTSENYKRNNDGYYQKRDRKLRAPIFLFMGGVALALYLIGAVHVAAFFAAPVAGLLVATVLYVPTKVIKLSMVRRIGLSVDDIGLSWNIFGGVNEYIYNNFLVYTPACLAFMLAITGLF